MSTSGNTAIIEENPWVSQLPLPTREERRQGLLAPVDTPVGRKHRPKLMYAGIAVGVLLLVVIAQLALSIGVSQGAYKLNSLQIEQKQLGRAYQAASEANDKLSSPQNLAANASALGMVANGAPVYLRLSNGAVVGSPTPAAGHAATSKATTVSALVPDSLLKNVPLVTAKGVRPSQVVTDSAPQPAAPQTPSQQTGSKAAGGTPAANVDPQQNGPVAWSGPLPAPSTH